MTYRRKVRRGRPGGRRRWLPPLPGRAPRGGCRREFRRRTRRPVVEKISRRHGRRRRRNVVIIIIIITPEGAAPPDDDDGRACLENGAMAGMVGRLGRRDRTVDGVDDVKTSCPSIRSPHFRVPETAPICACLAIACMVPRWRLFRSALNSDGTCCLASELSQSYSRGAATSTSLARFPFRAAFARVCVLVATRRYLSRRHKQYT